MNETDRQVGGGLEGNAGMRGLDALRKWAGSQGTVIRADVTPVAVNEEYSACQRDICRQNLVFRLSFSFFF